MRFKGFTLAEDKALLAEIAALPVAKLAALTVFLLLFNRPDRERVVAFVKSLG